VVYNHFLKLQRTLLSNCTRNHTHSEWQSRLSFNRQRLLCNHSVSSHQSMPVWYRSMQSLRYSSVGVSFATSHAAHTVSSKTTEADSDVTIHGMKQSN